jgi:hypothetical protein
MAQLLRFVLRTRAFGMCQHPETIAKLSNLSPHYKQISVISSADSEYET